jgi:hypothetical protein
VITDDLQGVLTLCAGERRHGAIKALGTPYEKLLYGTPCQNAFENRVGRSEPDRSNRKRAKSSVGVVSTSFDYDPRFNAANPVDEPDRFGRWTMRGVQDIRERPCSGSV